VPQVGLWRRGDPDAPNKLAVAVCTLGLMRVEAAVPLLMSGMPLGQAQLFVIPVGYGIQDARNIAWNAAEGQGWEYFMFWDDDVAPLKGGTAETMLEAMEQNPEIDILGGVYPARQNIPSPIVLKQEHGGPWWGWEDGGIHRVWMTGTGYTMYRMASLKKIDAPTKTFKAGDGGWEIREVFRLDAGTDDCVLAKDAEAAGLRWYVHGGIVCDQIEQNGLRFEVKNARQKIVEDAEEPVASAV
jgi:glycosyltransferase involved in cell wall biosynthesis